MDIHRKIFIAYKKSKRFSLLLEIYKSLNLRIPHCVSHVYIKDHYNNVEDSFIKLLERSTIQKYFRGMLTAYSRMILNASPPETISILSNICYILGQDLVLNEIDKSKIYRIVIELTDKFFDEDTLKVKDQANSTTTESMRTVLNQLLENARVYFNDDREFLFLKYLDNLDEKSTLKLHVYLKENLENNLPLLYKVLTQGTAVFEPDMYETLISLYQNGGYKEDDTMSQLFFSNLTLKNSTNDKLKGNHSLKAQNRLVDQRFARNKYVKLMLRQKSTQKTSYNILCNCIKFIQQRYNLCKIPELSQYSRENLLLIDENHIEKYLYENRTEILADSKINRVAVVAKILKTDEFTNSLIFGMFDVKKIVKKHYNDLINTALQTNSSSQLKTTGRTAYTEESNIIKTYEFIENVEIGHYEVKDNKVTNKNDILSTSNNKNTNDITHLNNLLLLNNIKRLSIKVNYDYKVLRRLFNVHKSVKITGVLLEGHINFDYLLLLNDVMASNILRRRSLKELFHKILYSEQTGRSLKLKYQILGMLIQQYREMDVFITDNNLYDVVEKNAKKAKSLGKKNRALLGKTTYNKKIYKRIDSTDINEDNAEILSVKIWDETQIFDVEETPYILKLLIACINSTKKGFLIRRIETKLEYYMSIHTCYFYGRDMNLFFVFLESILRYSLKNKKLLEKIFYFLLEYEQHVVLTVFYEHNRALFLYLCADVYQIRNYTKHKNVIWNEKHKKMLYEVLKL